MVPFSDPVSIQNPYLVSRMVKIHLRLLPRVNDITVPLHNFKNISVKGNLQPNRGVLRLGILFPSCLK